MSIERTVVRTPLGLRFRDAATEGPVTDGLSVRVWPADGRGRPARATRTRSGAWAAHGIAHLRGYERSGTGRPPARPYVVDVRDDRDRFVPVQIRVDLPPNPTDTVHGLYSILETPEDAARASDGDRPPDPACYLFSSVARERSGGLAAVRADLRTPSGDPAGHAVLEVSHEEETWFGLADDYGRVAVLFPYPALELEALPVWGTDGENGGGGDGDPPGGNGSPGGDGPPGDGPPGGNGDGGNGPPGNGPASPGDGTGANGGSAVGGSGRPISTRSWELAVSVHYAPDEQVDLPRSSRPLLTSLLGQSAGEIQPDLQGAFQDAIHPSLDYGRSLILRSHDSSDPSNPSHLVVRSAS